ncbi:hypothetical protein FF098_012660 [Parvularcula flava]|uniref:Uncharacterized protein n=1 Tax=Aquisalinus luteolus TaxID=1566827 RepID=A0A8J3EPR9_9PROT|nr:hypothetical protein [Aquisalinus luteolus]NHK28764.1 hypothetical protein [Aquisalinus luteolus]GGH99449.1 hypothetical protein GCM10011355_25430 [Aquisalinus luteolus]
MSTIATILATAAVTAGAVAVSRRFASKWREAKDILRRVREDQSPYAGPDVIDFEKDPETGTYQAREI